MPLILEVKCPGCEGLGKIQISGASPVPCETCRSSGVIPSPEGDAIIKFLDNHYRPLIRTEIIHPDDTASGRVM